MTTEKTKNKVGAKLGSYKYKHPLITLRISKGITQQQLATIAGVTRNTIYKIESRRTRFTEGMKTVIARSLGIDMAKLEDRR